MNLGVQNRAVKTATYIALITSTVCMVKRETTVPDPLFWAAMGAMFAASLVMIFERFRWGWGYLAISLWSLYSPPQTHPVSRVGAIVTLSVVIPMALVMGWGLYQNVRDRRTA